MTTVVWDSKTLAVDRLVGEFLNIGKIFPIKGSGFLTGCGNYDDLVEVAEWVNKGDKKMEKPLVPETNIFTFYPSGESYWLTVPNLRPIRFSEPFFAFGSGAAWALGALCAGVGAKRACEIACRYDPQSGKGVDSIRVVPPVKKSKP